MRIGMLAAAVLAGCGFIQTKPTEHRVQTQDEAGSVHIAVLSVAPWEKYKQDLQPHFEMTPEMALDRVLSISGATSSQQIDNTSLEVTGSVGPTVPGVATPAKTPKPGAKRAARPSVGPALKVYTPQSDPMTQYWAATALYQEVQLLNRYVEDAAIRKGYKAYVLRLQITLLPRARHEPYDAYSNVSFFVTDADEGSSSRDASERDPGKAEVLPLLVTDNLEATLASGSRESMRRLAASLGVGSGSAGGSISASKATGEIDTSSGLDLNSLLTVARVSGNTLRIRLGAMKQGSSGYAMIPRSHAVTVLVMVKERQNHIALVSRTTMVDVKDGSQLRDRTQEEVDQALLAAGERYGVADLEILSKLFRKAQANNVAEFYADLREWEAAQEVSVPYKTSLWLDLVSVRAGSQYNSLVVDLEPATAAPPVAVTMPPSPVTLVDDGTTCTMTLPYAPGLVQGKLTAALVIDGISTACDVVVTPGGEVLIIYRGTLSTRGTGGVRLELKQGKAFAEYEEFNKK